MIVVFFVTAFTFQRKSEVTNYSALIWLPPYKNACLVLCNSLFNRITLRKRKISQFHDKTKPVHLQFVVNNFSR